MEWVALILAVIAVALIASQKFDEPDPASLEDLGLPTVSQNRNIPLVVGEAKITGPNVLDGGRLRTRKIKVKVGFKKKTVGYRYYMDQELAIAWGQGELKEIWFGDQRAWTGSLSTQSELSINLPELFGDKDAQGGVAGTMEFIPGISGGTVSSYLESRLSRSQPGYPHLARVIAKDFYFGNSETFKGISFVYGYYPNPFGATNHKIGNSANPAYVLYMINKDNRFGLDIKGTVNVSAIQAMAAQLYAEGLGMSRVWYQGDGEKIESEILSLIEGVRYRDPLTGDIIYKLVRNDYDVESLPVLSEANIIGAPAIDGGGLSATATEVTLNYIDHAAGFKKRAITLPNIAARMQLGRRIAMSRDFLGSDNATLAQQLAAREAMKFTKPLKSGSIVADRTAWDWVPGDTFVLTHSPSNITQIIARVVNISRGTLTDGRVEIEFTEDVFGFGASIYNDVPANAPVNAANDPADVTVFQSIDLPVFLIEDESPYRVSILADDPTGDSLGYLMQVNSGGGYVDEGEQSEFAETFTLNATIAPLDNSVVVNGRLDADNYNASSVLANGYNLLLFVDAGKQSILAFESSSYDSGTDKTTLTGIHWGLVDTAPKQIPAGSRVWLLEDIVAMDSTFAVSQNISYRMLPRTSKGILAEGSATVRNHTVSNRYDKPFLPGNIKLNAQLFPSSVTGPLAATWNHRDRTQQAYSLIDWTDSSDQGQEAGTTYSVNLYNDTTSALLDSQTGLSGKTYNFSSPGLNATLRIEVTAVRAGLNSHETFVHVFTYSEA
jgi:hypothetical protein